jgi:hypothetical protein
VPFAPYLFQDGRHKTGIARREDSIHRQFVLLRQFLDKFALQMHPVVDKSCFVSAIPLRADGFVKQTTARFCHNNAFVGSYLHRRVESHKDVLTKPMWAVNGKSREFRAPYSKCSDSQGIHGRLWRVQSNKSSF